MHCRSRRSSKKLYIRATFEKKVTDVEMEIKPLKNKATKTQTRRVCFVHKLHCQGRLQKVESAC
uniref:Uncharacterized protein n=1 Tax=Manihot esculenta TaxID=3983 RepID=A0A2C9U3M2_MANES